MPFARCKFYTESGEPFDGGCRRKGCAFIHPGDSDWINAPPSFRARGKGGDSGSSRSWGGKHTAPPTRETSGSASGWGTGSGWAAGTSTSTSSWAPEPAVPNNQSTTNSEGANDGWGTGWGNDTDKDAGSAWGSTQNNGWGTGWGNKDADKDAGSARGSAQNGGRGTGWGNKDTSKDAGSTWGSTQNDGWGTGWGNTDADKGTWGSASNKDATDFQEASDPMIVDCLPEEGVERKKGKGRTPAPPRIRIPDTRSKKPKISELNDEPLSAEKWGEPRGSNLVTASTPATALTIDPLDLKGKHDAASDDMSNVFKEYAKIWERGVRARFLLAEAQAQRDRWFHTQKSACYARIGEAGRKRLDGQRAEYDKEVNLQKDKLSSAISSLVEFHDTVSSKLDLCQRYNISKETETFIAESKAFVDEIRALLVARVLGDKGDAQYGDIQKHTAGADATLIDSLRSQVRDLEERFDQAQTELTLRHRYDILSEIDERLAAKISALRVARQQEIDSITQQQRAEIVIPQRAIENTEGTAQQVRELHAKVPCIVEDVRMLLLRVDATTKRVSELEEQLSVNKATHTKVQERVAEREQIEQRIDERLEKIREQFEQLVASQSPTHAVQPAVSPTCSSQDGLMESLRPAFEALLEQFYEREVRPTVESLQRVVVETSDRHQEEAIKVLWGKIQPAMNMVAGVSRWLDSQELELTASVEERAYAVGS